METLTFDEFYDIIRRYKEHYPNVIPAPDEHDFWNPLRAPFPKYNHLWITKNYVSIFYDIQGPSAVITRDLVWKRFKITFVDSAWQPAVEIKPTITHGF